MSSSSLPPGWSKKESKSHPGKIFYYNESTKEKSWTRPTNNINNANSNSQSGSKRSKHDDTDANDEAEHIMKKKKVDDQVHVLHILRKHRLV